MSTTSTTHKTKPRVVDGQWPPEPKPAGIQISLRLQREVLLKLQRLAEAARMSKSEFISRWVESLP